MLHVHNYNVIIYSIYFNFQAFFLDFKALSERCDCFRIPVSPDMNCLFIKQSNYIRVNIRTVPSEVRKYKSTEESNPMVWPLVYNKHVSNYNVLDLHSSHIGAILSIFV